MSTPRRASGKFESASTSGIHTGVRAAAINALPKARSPHWTVLSIVADQDLAVQAVQLGAQDYLIKGIVDSGGLVRSIRYARERQKLLEERAAGLKREKAA